jgi:hypothetical protein
MWRNGGIKVRETPLSDAKIVVHMNSTMTRFQCGFRQPSNRKYVVPAFCRFTPFRSLPGVLRSIESSSRGKDLVNLGKEAIQGKFLSASALEDPHVRNGIRNPALSVVLREQADGGDA